MRHTRQLSEASSEDLESAIVRPPTRHCHARLSRIPPRSAAPPAPLSHPHTLHSLQNAGWVILCTALVFWEQAGFAMWESGSLPTRSLHSILLKNMCDAAIAGFAFLACGWAFAFGVDRGDLIGSLLALAGVCVALFWPRSGE